MRTGSPEKIVPRGTLSNIPEGWLGLWMYLHVETTSRFKLDGGED
jgi:hypothetical protein